MCAPNSVGCVDLLDLSRYAPPSSYRRPYVRKSTRQAIERSAAVKNGKFSDSNTGLPITGGKRRIYSRQKDNNKRSLTTA